MQNFNKEFHFILNPQSLIPNQSPENFRPTDLPFLKKYIFSIKFSKTLHFVFDILLDYSKDDVYSVSTRFKTIIYYVITIFEAQKNFLVFNPSIFSPSQETVDPKVDTADF